MTPNEYIHNVMRTDAGPNPKSRERAVENFSLLHSCMGICTESGELMDAVKKTIVYGKALDVVNVKEEIGDLFWYIGLLCNSLGLSFEEIWETNIAKLRKRYPQNFTEAAALDRDLSAERSVLEGN